MTFGCWRHPRIQLCCATCFRLLEPLLCPVCSPALSAWLFSLRRLPQQAPLTLEQIMADPDWIAASIEVPELFDDRGVPPYFSVDGQSVYYRVKRSGSPIKDLHRINLADGADSTVDAAAMANADGAQTVFDASRRYAAFVRNGDIFLREVASGRLTQATRTAQDETAPQFSADRPQAVVPVRTGLVRLRHRRRRRDACRRAEARERSGCAGSQARRSARLAAAPVHDAEKGARRQARHTRKRRTDAEGRSDRAHRCRSTSAMKCASSAPALSPDTRRLFVVTVAKSHDEGKKGKLTRYVTESGYEEFEDERTRVGRNDSAPQTLWLFDLSAHTKTQLKVDGLPGVHDDPLKSVRAENAAQTKGNYADRTDVNGYKEKADKTKDEAKARTLEVMATRFSEDGANAAVELRSLDNKDRWIASVDFFQAGAGPAASAARRRLGQLDVQRLRLCA
jgi:hypothetical protein